MMDAVATRTFTLTTTVAATPEDVIGFLLQLDAHHGIHPYLQSATVTATGDDAGAAWSDWSVEERPRLGPLRYTIRFPARMTRTAAGAMTGSVRAAPGCRLTTSTRAEATAAGTVVIETTEVSAPLPLLGYMTRHARLAHERTFSLLGRELAARRG